MTNGKAVGEDLILAELMKAHLDFTAEKVKVILDEVWRQEKTPERRRRGLVVKLPKKENCKNWRGITLLPVVSKVLGRILVDRIKRGVNSRLRKEQAGYRTGPQLQKT